MTTNFALAGAIQVREIAARRIPRLLDERLGLKLMPVRKADEWKLIYEQRDFQRGLQNARGMGGKLGVVNRTGFTSFETEPGMFGDVFKLFERDVLQNRMVGDWFKFDNKQRYSAEASEQLTDRMFDRMEYAVWQMLFYGQQISIDKNGVEVQRQIFDIPAPLVPPVLFTNSSATPRTWLRETIAKLNLRGLSVHVDEKCVLVCNSNTRNVILSNTNANDLGGVRLQYGQTVYGPELLNGLLKENNIPPITTYDRGWFPEDKTQGHQPFIPDGMMLLLGRRDDNAPVGEYRMCRNAYNDDAAPGECYRVIDKRQLAVNDNNGSIVDFECMHNGGAVPYYPDAIVPMQVYVPS